jgi:hypothetical protein
MKEPEQLLPRIEDFRSDLSGAEIGLAEASNTRAIGMQAYIYALPAFLHLRQLGEIIQARQYMAPDEFPLGGWLLVRQLSDASTNNVMPNVDTLYGACFLLLNEQGPVVLTVPPIPDRYYSVAILDAYYNNFAIVSPRTYGSTGGHYLITPPGWTGTVPEGIDAVFAAPTPAVTLYQRIFARSAQEYPELHRLQDAVTVVPLAQWQQPAPRFPAFDLSPYALQGLRETRDPLRFFELTSAYMAVNPPPATDAGLMALFKSAGVGPGAALPENPALRTALCEGAADAQRVINARISAGPFRRGWRIPDPNTGRAGPHPLSRAVVQLFQIGSFVPEEALYFFGFKDGNGETLTGHRRYTMTFAPGELPPLHPQGFWSLTMYNKAGLLVDNPLNRYIVRPDAPGLTYGADGSLTLYIQADYPAGVPEGNWLPAAASDFFVGLRAYLPQQMLLDGSWFPPAITLRGE